MATLIKGKPFKCPKCGHDRIEEVMTNVVQSTVINSVHEENLVDHSFSEFNTSGGNVDRYQCVGCGIVVSTSQGTLLEDLEKIFKGYKAEPGSIEYEEDERILALAKKIADNNYPMSCEQCSAKRECEYVRSIGVDIAYANEECFSVLKNKKLDPT